MRLGGRLDSGDELANPRRNLIAEAGAVEDAVMADPFREVILLPRFRDINAQFIGRVSLADARDVVLLPFDGQQAAIADGGQINPPPAMGHLAFWQRVTHENRLDRL